MDGLERILIERIKDAILRCQKENIYCMSITARMVEKVIPVNDIWAATEITIQFNSEDDVTDVELDSEARWNTAFWDSSEEFIVVDSCSQKDNDTVNSWLKEKGVQKIGYEDSNLAYNDRYEYIGNGPNGYCELIGLLADIVRILQEEVIFEKFGNIPVIIHDYDYSRVTLEVTCKINNKKLISDFCAWIEKEGKM